MKKINKLNNAFNKYERLNIDKKLENKVINIKKKNII